ncbi:hypothetical protein AKJ65_04165 [candidate division MSBL1 archaeon SCGC-AAA259E19]|uniref:CARDB domain-containing protein n=1 Tax=candidate division MSBL1 archaeon SCGC-AAA259E19 TaxID=1698264 RepID=A0A133UJW2_9EURY|nr:hypothetical protein AKJ65_04165 [candidate division MSBL1 archaeon SCGC-AAA259E19]
MSKQQRRRTSKFAIAMIIVGVVMAGGIFWVLLSSGGGGGANEPLFRIENVTVPSKAETGDEIAIITTVRNVGGKKGTYVLNPKVNGERQG